MTRLSHLDATAAGCSVLDAAAECPARPGPSQLLDHTLTPPDTRRQNADPQQCDAVPDMEWHDQDRRRQELCELAEPVPPQVRAWAGLAGLVLLVLAWMVAGWLR